MQVKDLTSGGLYTLTRDVVYYHDTKSRNPKPDVWKKGEVFLFLRKSDAQAQVGIRSDVFVAVDPKGGMISLPVINRIDAAYDTPSFTPYLAKQRKGGQTTLAKHGPDHFRRMAAASNAKQKAARKKKVATK